MYGVQPFDINKNYNSLDGVVELFSRMLGKEIDLSLNRIQLNLNNLWYFQIEMNSGVGAFLEGDGEILVVGPWAYEV